MLITLYYFNYIGQDYATKWHITQHITSVLLSQTHQIMDVQAIHHKNCQFKTYA